jgi:hypothetical protein
MLDTMEPATIPTPATLQVSGKSSRAGGALTILVDGVEVLTRGPLDEGASFEANIDIPAGEHVIVARLEGGAEDSVRGTFASGENRSLRIAAHRTFGAPVKLKLGRPPG